jgi:hypothetical protein
LQAGRGKDSWRKLFGVSSTLQYATTFIALAAFILAVLSLYLQRKDKRPRLKVTTEFYLAIHFRVLSCQVVNVGGVAVQLVALYLIPPHGTELLLAPVPEYVRPHLAEGEQRLPYWIQPGERVRLTVFEDEVAQMLRSAGYSDYTFFTIAVVDAMGNAYTTHDGVPVGKSAPDS